MIKYIITSETYSGEVILTYDENGERPSIDCHNTTMRADQHKWLHQWICKMGINHNTLAGTLNACKLANLTFKEVTFEPTFSDFWKRYFKDRYKDNSSKKKTEIRWNKMGRRSQLAAYNYIGQYFLQIPTGTEPKLAETYLNSEVWVK